MSKLDEYEKVLDKIKFNIHTDIRQLRVEYMKKMQEIEEKSKQKGLLGRKKSVDSIVKKKKTIKKSRASDIAAYEIIENLVNDYLKQIKESRIYIKKHIQKKAQ